MEYGGVPIIVICSYLVGELYKLIVKNNKETYKYIPIITSIFGGILGCLIYFTNPSVIFNASNVYVALGIGIISGSSATGTNQIIKQIFKNNNEKK